jgi:hypothetical protein
MTGIYMVYTWTVPFLSYTRYIPGVLRSYELNGNIPGIYLVYTQDFHYLGTPDGVCYRRYSFCRLNLNSHQFFAAACGGPEIAFANSFREPLKKCTKRRLRTDIADLIFHVVLM